MDEPTNRELAWRLDQIQSTLSGAVGRLEYIADKRGTDQRLDTLERGISEAKRSGFEAIGRVNARMDEHEKSHKAAGVRWQTLLWTGVLPVLVAAIGVLATLYLSHGGH